MFHGLSNQFLYSAHHLHCIFENRRGYQHSCTGTGFWMRDSDSRFVLITNRHMLDVEYVDSKYAGFNIRRLIVSSKVKDPSSGLPNIDQKLLVDCSNIKYLIVYENDIACLINPSVSSMDGASTVTLDNWINHDLFATKIDFESKINICDFVAFPGFPQWHDKRENRPILRTGTISSDPRFNYSWSSEYQGECIAYEAFSYGGSSGSPVFAVQKGPKPGKGISFPGFRDLKLIGINAGHLPAAQNTHSGISYLYKASAILDIVDAK